MSRVGPMTQRMMMTVTRIVCALTLGGLGIQAQSTNVICIAGFDWVSSNIDIMSCIESHATIIGHCFYLFIYLDRLDNDGVNDNY